MEVGSVNILRSKLLRFSQAKYTSYLMKRASVICEMHRFECYLSFFDSKSINVLQILKTISLK